MSKDKLPQLTDPQNVDNELGAEDFAAKEPSPLPNENEIISHVEECFQAAVNARQQREPQMFLSLAFFLGQQHVGYSLRSRRLVDVRGGSDDWRSYEVRNKIKPKVLKLQARAMESLPDPSFRPTLWSSVTDREAATEARVVHVSCNRKHNQDVQVGEEILWALTTSTVCRKYAWDPTALAEVPDYDAAGNLVGTTMAKVGEIGRETVPIFDLYPDPKAKIRKGKIVDCAWIIHSHIRPVSDVQAHYGERALKMVSGEIAAGQDGYIESRMQSIVGDSQNPGGERKTGVVVKEKWDLPCKAYPNGRLIVTAGGHLLRYDEEWPTEKRDAFPFVPLCFVNTPGSFYGQNAVWELIGAQRTYNRAVNTMNDFLEHPWGKWLIPRGAQIGSDSLTDPREALYYTPGFRPEYQGPPPVTEAVVRAMQAADADLNDLSGVHDVSEGQAPPNVTAASALEILRQQDTSQMKPFLSNLNVFVKQCAEWEVALARQFYTEPRLMALEDSTPLPASFGAPSPTAPDGAGTPPASSPLPDAGLAGPTPTLPGVGPRPPVSGPSGYAQVMAFRALTAGGSCHIGVDDGTAAQLSPVTRLQMIQQLFPQGFFGPPGDPRSTLIALEMMDEIRTDPLVERLIQLRTDLQQEAQAMQQTQLQAQQAQGQNQQALMQQQAQAAQQMAQLQAELKQAAAAAQAGQQAAADAQKHQHEAEMQAVQLHADLSKAEVTHAHDVERAAQQIAHEQSHVNVSLTGKLAPPETTEAAHDAGLQE